MGPAAEECPPGETASPRPPIGSVASPCTSALGKAPARGRTTPAPAAPAGKDAPKKEGGIEQAIMGLVGK